MAQSNKEKWRSIRARVEDNKAGEVDYDEWLQLLDAADRCAEIETGTMTPTGKTPEEWALATYAADRIAAAENRCAALEAENARIMEVLRRQLAFYNKAAKDENYAMRGKASRMAFALQVALGEIDGRRKPLGSE